MTYVKINGTLYPAEIEGRIKDYEWDERSSQIIRLTMSAATAVSLFVDDVQWSIVDEFIDENDETVQVEFDNSEYCVAGDVTDHRNGTVSVKMGKTTEAEILAIITGGAE